MIGLVALVAAIFASGALAGAGYPLLSGALFFAAIATAAVVP